MGSILNGIALHGGLIPYGGTFLVFADYMRPAIRLAALMEQRVIYVFTHDSIGLGEDGPTHQPIEQLASLRAIPHLTVLRPADANEVAVAWDVAIRNHSGPVALALSRQAVPTLDRTQFASADGLRKGAYVLADLGSGDPELILMASGTEVSIAIEAAQVIANKDLAVRVVSFPSWDLFSSQDESYRNQVLPPTIKARLAIEAGVPMGWEKWVGNQGAIMGIDRFGASAPYKVIYEKYGLTADKVVETALAVLERTKEGV
jgi:transketolase